MAKFDANLLPCSTCPWRIGKDATTIPNYSHEKACGLMATVGRGDAFRTIMACHGSPVGEERACNGYLAREGWSNINVRLLLAKGKILNPADILDACDEFGVELETDYPTVLEKLTESIGDDTHAKRS